MVDIHKEDNVFGVQSCTRSGLVESIFYAGNNNGFATDSRRGLRTYKRRKNGSFVGNGMIWDDFEARFDEKSIMKPDQVIHTGSHDVPIASDNSSLEHQRNIVLEQICRSMEIEHNLKKCIQDALAFHQGIRSRTIVKESVQSCEAVIRGTFYGTETATRCSEEMASWESAKEPSQDTITELFRCTLPDIIMSENFAQLCNLLLENGIKVEELLDLSRINSRTKEKIYESSPTLFHSDIQQMWMKVRKVGTEMVAIAKCLSDKTTSLFREQVGTVAHCSSDNVKCEFHTQESDMLRAELAEDSALQVHSCRECGEKADGGNPHDDCIACERLNNRNGEDEAIHEEASDGSEESLNELVANERDKRFSHCMVCRTEVRNDEAYLICGHSFCPHKFYHTKCLTSKQLVSYGPCWYCPSCLCRTCFSDQDDNMIVLCDGCDNAYHIYCMRPPRTTIPRGKWFCTKCNAGIQRVHKARHSYEKMLNRSRKQFVYGRLKAEEEGLNKSGGVDMLLKAAKTLNYEESMASRKVK